MRRNPNRSRKLPHSLLSHLHRFGVHEGGATAVIAAILFPVVIGGMGLGAETGYWYLTERKLQHIADISAHAAGTRKRAGDTNEKIIAAAAHVANQSGLPASGALTVNLPPASGGFVGDADSVEVIATDTQPRLFSAVVAGFFSNDPQMTVTMAGRAVARIDETAGGVACVLALSPTASGALTVAGSTTIALSGCDVASNSNASNAFQMDGSNAKLSTGCAYTVGEAITSVGLTLNECDEVKEYAPIIPDPYRSVKAPLPSTWGSCTNQKQGSLSGSVVTVTPRCFNGLTVMGRVHFSPGVYIINGGEFKALGGENAVLTGQGVTFYLVNGARLNIAANIKVNFSAPTSGNYSGLLFFGDRTTTGITHRVAGTSDSDYTGAIYAPASHIEFSGNSKLTGNGCTQIIGATVKLTGNSSLKSTCETAGTTDIATNMSVKIVE